jgi:hypothetical protein
MLIPTADVIPTDQFHQRDDELFTHKRHLAPARNAAHQIPRNPELHPVEMGRIPVVLTF